MLKNRAAPVRWSNAILFSGVAAAFLAMAAPAQAQFGYEPDFVMPPRAVAWRLSERGFTEIGRPRFDGRAYVVEASGPYGDRVRLFVDARDGAIIGRQRLGAPIAAPRLAARPSAPGYGWTEEDEQAGRPMRGAGRLLPPADIPTERSARRPLPESYPRQGAYPSAGPDPKQEAFARPEPVDRNPSGLNPDARHPDARAIDAKPRQKAARLPPPAKPATPRAAPQPSEAAPAASAAKPDAPSAALAATRSDAPKTADLPTPAAAQPPPSERPTASIGGAQAWTNPPADAKRPVRVIGGGATIVPGAGDKAQAPSEGPPAN